MRRRGRMATAGLALGLIVAAGCNAEDPGPTTGEECPPSTEWDADSGDSAPQNPPASTCEPGPDEETNTLAIDGASLESGADRDVAIELEVTNTTGLSQAMVLPSSIEPRVDESRGIRRLSFLRINMTLDESPAAGGLPEPRVNVADPGWPAHIAIAAGETLSYTDVIVLDAEYLAEQMQICAEVMPEPHPEAPAAKRETGETSAIVLRGFGWEGEPVPLTCSEVFEVGRPSDQSAG